MAVTGVLLAAGYGTRLYPLTKDRPKALLPLGEGTLLDALLYGMEGVPGLARYILVTNSCFAGQFETWVKRAEAPVTIIDDGTDTNETRLGAVRDLELARKQGKAEGDLLVVGTDNLFGWRMKSFVQQAQAHAPHPSVALWEAPSANAATQFGVVLMDGSNRITRFVEKSPTPPSKQVALCVYYFPESMLGRIQEFMDQGGNSDAPGFLIEWLVRREPTYGVPMSGAWFDIGSPEAYEAAQQAWPQLSASISRG